MNRIALSLSSSPSLMARRTASGAVVAKFRSRPQTVRCMAVKPQAEAHDHQKTIEKKDANNASNLLPVAGAFLYPLVVSDPALAIGREYGFIEGQIMSLMHPAFMFFLLGASMYAGYLGFQWRRVRELATEIKDLKSQRDASASPVEEGGAAPASPLDATIKSLENVRTYVLLMFMVVFQEPMIAPPTT
jgi:hypothetical protein